MLVDVHQPASERLNCIETIRRNGQHLLTIINDILDISRIEAGCMVIERIPCSPAEIVQDVVALMLPRVEEKGLKFEVHYGTRIPAMIHSDPTRLRQILTNLIGNAVKFTESGTIRLETCLQDGPDTAKPLPDGYADARTGRLRRDATAAGTRVFDAHHRTDRTRDERRS